MTVKSVLIITAIVILLIVGIFVYANIKAKANLAKIEPADYSASGTYTDAESKQIRVLSESIMNDLNGVNWMGHNYDLYDQMLKLSDKLFVGVCIDFQRVNSGTSFRTAFQDDKTSFKAFDHIFSSLYDDVVARLNTLNIT